MTGEHPAAASRRISKSEAEMGRAVAVIEVRLDELRRDLSRLEDASGSHAKRVTTATEKASHAIGLAKRAMDEAKRSIDTVPIQVSSTGPHSTVSNGHRREVAVAGTATVGGAGLYALVEFLIRSLMQ